jgi:hypothetical protein
MLRFLGVGRGPSLTNQQASRWNVRIYPRIHLAIGIHPGELRLALLHSNSLQVTPAAAIPQRHEHFSYGAVDRSSHTVLQPAAALIPVFRHSLLTRTISPEVRHDRVSEGAGMPRSVAPAPMVSAVLREQWIRRTARTEERSLELSEMMTRRQVESPASRPGPPSPVASAQQHPPQFPDSKPSFETIHTAPWVKAPAPAPVIVDRLTDQVIRQIDDRMMAWRERMGKV